MDIRKSLTKHIAVFIPHFRAGPLFFAQLPNTGNNPVYWSAPKQIQYNQTKITMDTVTSGPKPLERV